MTTEIISVDCPTLTFYQARILSEQLRGGIFSKQSSPKLESRVLIKFIDKQPAEIMCPGINSCGCVYGSDCHFKKWFSLKTEGE